MSEGNRPAGQLEAGVRVGDFEIERRLGAGGMGIVYQARQLSLDRVVALKVLGSALTRPTDLERFQREARAAARLKHPGITAIHFIGQDAEICYHVMEFVDGIPLQRVIERLGQTVEVLASPETVVAAELTTQLVAPVVRFDGPTTVDEVPHGTSQPTADHDPRGADRARATITTAGKQTRASPRYVRRCCELARDVARALAYAHGEGVIHRDIKPENLMLDRDGRVRVIDFGLARYFDDDSITHTGQLLGTPLYMSPEQVTGRFPVDHRTDVYSLGVVLYELLALRRPFEASSREDLLRRIVTKALPPLGGRNPALPKALEAVVHKATYKDPEERYQSAADLADELDRFLAGKPVSAPPYRYRLDFQEILSRRPGSVVLAAFICLLLGTAVSVMAASVGAMMLAITGVHLATLAQIGGSVLVLCGSLFVTRRLLSGWNWARWVAVAASGLTVLALVVATGALVVALVTQLRDAPPAAPSSDPETVDTRKFLFGMVAMYAIPIVLAAGCAVTALGCLVLPRTRAWFRLARQAREEHAELLRTLGE